VDLTDRLAREAGIAPEVLAELPRFRESSLFSDLEKLTLEYAEAITGTPARVPEELFRALEAQLSPEQMVELTAAVALENFSARFNQAFAIEPLVLSRQ
jgi:alkylhydroperoxidase family enzyme